MSKEMNSFLSIVSDMLITKVIDRSVKMTTASVSYVFSNLRNKDISIIQTNHLQFPEISRKSLELQTLLKKSLILIATFLNKSTNIIVTLVTTFQYTNITQ